MTEELLIQKLSGIRFSEGGTIAHLRVGLGPDSKAAELSFPVAGVLDIWTALGGIVAALRDEGVLPAEEKPPGTQTTGIMTKSWKLGGNTFDKNILALLLDEGQSTETLRLFPSIVGLQIADAIEQTVLNGLSLDEQKALMTEVEKSTGRKPRIIMPNVPRSRQ